MLILDRRSLFAAFVAGAVAMAPVVALAEDTVDTTELLSPGPLGDKSLGSADAPVSVVEYASMSCPHCAHFDETTFDDFKIKYIDSGKVRYVFREFPLNAPAYAAAMVARCAPADRYFDIVHAYFRSQEEWLMGSDVKAGLFEVAKTFGFTPDSFNACLENQALFKAIDGVKNRGASFGVQATPTFFINGKRVSGALTLDELDKEIQPLM